MAADFPDFRRQVRQREQMKVTQGKVRPLASAKVMMAIVEPHPAGLYRH